MLNRAPKSNRLPNPNNIYSSADYRTPALIAVAIVLLHLSLLALSIPDYRVTLDSAYHVAMGRQWIDHFPALWDRVNFAPASRPNLQGPLFQIAIGSLGKLLGGNGDDYVLANAILAVVQWLAAILTAGTIAFALADAWAALVAVALISGAAFTSTSFAIGIPSGWVLIFTIWSVWSMLRGRVIAASIMAALATYVHVGGIAVVGLGLLSAAAIARRWRTLIVVSLIAGAIVAPYVFFVAWHLSWFGGDRSHSALLFDPLLEILGIIAAVWIMTRVRSHPLLAAILIAPLAWAPHDPGRFILLWGLPAGIGVGVMLAHWILRSTNSHRARATLILLAAVATVLPLGIPSLAPEIGWLIGPKYPRAVDWSVAKQLAGTLKHDALDGRIVADYQPALCDAIAVYGPVRCEKGHWIEVQPPNDPADAMPVASKVYVLPIAANDPTLKQLASSEWLRLYGGGPRDTVATVSGTAESAQEKLAGMALIRESAEWLSENAISNAIRLRWDSAETGAEYRDHLRKQRATAGMLELGVLMLAQSMEDDEPANASRMRRIARGFGVLASLLGDELAIDYLSDRQVARLRSGLLTIATSAHADHPAEVIEPSEHLLRVIFDGQLRTFAERPAGNPTPWLEDLRR